MPPSVSCVLRRACLAAAGLGLLSGAQGASAADQLWWGNGSSGTPGLVRSNADGSGVVGVIPQSVSGRVNSSVPDPARGRVYWLTRSNDPTDPNALYRANLDGTGVQRIGDALGGLPTATYTTSGLSIDTATQTLYWVIATSSAVTPIRIRWSSADGASAGTLYDSTTAAPALPATDWTTYSLSIDHEHNRIWWTNYAGDVSSSNPPLGYANLDGTGDAHALRPVCTSMNGGLPSSVTPNAASSITVDHVNGYLYARVERMWQDGWFIARMGLDGSDCVRLTTQFSSGSAKGAVLDPDTHWLYTWRGLDGPETWMDVNGALPIALPTEFAFDPAAVGSNPRYPALIKRPRLGGALTVAASGSTAGSTLSCTCTTVDDQVPMGVYRGAQTESIQWYRDGVLIPGATGKTLVADQPGSYTAVLTAANVAGEMVETSNAVVIAASPAPVEPKKDDAVAPKVTLPAASIISGTSLTTVVNPSAPGTVTVAATLRGRTVCTATKKAKKAGRMTVTCALGPAARAAIRLRPVTLTVTATLTDAAGKTASAKRTVKVPRYRVRTPVTG